MEPGDPAGPVEQAPPAPSARSSKIVLFLIIVLVLAAAGFLLLRRGGVGSRTAAPAPAGPASGAGQVPPGLNVVVAPVRLSPEAALVADRYKCLCGECQDTLGKCTCKRDKGSNEMKTALNRIVAEKKTLTEIDAAMVAKFGPAVLAVSPAPEESTEQK